MSATGELSEVTSVEFAVASALKTESPSIEVRFLPAIAEMPAVEGGSLAYPDYLACVVVEHSSLSPYPVPGSGGLTVVASDPSAEGGSSYSDGGYPGDSYPYRPFHPFQAVHDACRRSG